MLGIFFDNKGKSYLIDHAEYYSVVELDSDTIEKLRKDTICIDNIRDSVLRYLITNQIII